MPTTDVSGLTHGFVSGQRGWGGSMNRNIELLSRVLSQYAVLSIVSTPPASPSNGDSHIVGATPTGAWSRAVVNQLAYYESSWTFYTPLVGLQKYVNNQQALYVYTGSAWVAVAAQPWTGTQTEYDALSSDAKAMPRLHLITG